MRGTSGTTAEAPNSALISLPVAGDILVRASGAPGEQRPVPMGRYRFVLDDRAQSPDPGSVEMRRLRQEILQSGIFLPVERGEPRDMNRVPIRKLRHQRWRRQIVSCGDASDPRSVGGGGNPRINGDVLGGRRRRSAVWLGNRKGGTGVDGPLMASVRTRRTGVADQLRPARAVQNDRSSMVVPLSAVPPYPCCSWSRVCSRQP